MLFSMLIVLYFYISTLGSMCIVPNMTVFCSSFISCFSGVLLTYFLNDYEKFYTYTINQQMHIYKYAQSHSVILQQNVSITAVTNIRVSCDINPLNAKLNPICWHY